ncbi:FAD-dependent oxidoreductase [Cyanobium sp. Morenito 9A2]|uniref:flavin monoamine oxidase family protein n=1 Tax=Cyanobium sp. Morenito 9A2 TaxID=2823718 RepID=UPI0020CC4475|nr:FAD-dependent oxidoreductase [Cyanobium sp. Morenito 9A2]MCP9849391.1 FAD-dependent oxidoreductase [Cyanobium sp. Morenito 9A2]
MNESAGHRAKSAGSGPSSGSYGDSALDVAIVGAGVAGTFTAWRLKVDRPELSVALFEASPRLGGRLYSQHLPDARGVPIEHGGMRFSRQHRLLAALVEHLGLPTRPFVSVLEGRNPLYLRGVRTSLQGLAHGETVPYALPPELTNQDPAGIIPFGVATFLSSQGLPLTSRVGLLEQLARADYSGRAFADLSFLDFLRQVCTPEMLAYYNDVHGYWVDTHNDVSAAELMKGFLPFISDAETLTLSEGMDSLPRTLGARAADRGCPLHLGCALESIRLEHDREGCPWFEIGMGSSAGRRRHRARALVLALPPNRLRVIDGLLELAPSLAPLLNRVVEIAAIKTHFVYAEPWWRQLGIVAGEGRTDLPLRQCLYMGSADAGQPADGPGWAVLLASYTDSQATEFWRRQQAKGESFDRRRGHPEDRSLGCSAPHFDHLSAMLAELHGRELPDPVWASSCDWNCQPSGVATHAWRSGSDSAELAPRIRQPLPGLPLYITGEAFSQEQGWVNGALRSAEALLRSAFQLPSPPWCPADAPLDPLP